MPRACPDEFGSHIWIQQVDVVAQLFFITAGDHFGRVDPFRHVKDGPITDQRRPAQRPGRIHMLPQVQKLLTTDLPQIPLHSSHPHCGPATGGPGKDHIGGAVHANVVASQTQ